MNTSTEITFEDPPKCPCRVGQWKFTEKGAVKCIGEGDGWVMCRGKGREPFCMPVQLWDESMNHTCPEGWELNTPGL